jgi:hypothetical protein
LTPLIPAGAVIVDEPKYYRSVAQARALRPRAIDFLLKLESMLPPGQFDIAYDTCFVGQTVPEEVGCVAVSVIGIPGSLTALEFALHEEPEAQADALNRYRARLIAEHDGGA